MTALALDKVPMQRLDMDPMPDPDRIPTNLIAARAAYDELGKALDTGCSPARYRELLKLADEADAP